MSWVRHNLRTPDPRVERQLHDQACGAACAVMLLGDRGVIVDQITVLEELRVPCDGEPLAARIQRLLPGHTWLGGGLDMDVPRSPSGFRDLRIHGSWAALLFPTRSLVGHWVVIDQVGDEFVAVRDPAGASYDIPFPEFQRLMRYMVVVIEPARST